MPTTSIMVSVAFRRTKNISICIKDREREPLKENGISVDEIERMADDFTNDVSFLVEIDLKMRYVVNDKTAKLYVREIGKREPF